MSATEIDSGGSARIDEMAIHRFSAIQRDLRDSWFEMVETSDPWEDRGPIGEGESQSIRVVNKMDGMIGVAKPGPARGMDENHCRARVGFCGNSPR